MAKAACATDPACTGVVYNRVKKSGRLIKNPGGYGYNADLDIHDKVLERPKGQWKVARGRLGEGKSIDRVYGTLWEVEERCAARPICKAFRYSQSSKRGELLQSSNLGGAGAEDLYWR